MKTTVPVLRRLIGNPDAYALQDEDGGWRPVRSPLTPKVLRQHLAGDVTVGTYVLHGDQARTLVFDVDQDDMPLVERLCKSLYELGIPTRHIGVEFSGRKGYHVWVVLKDYRPAVELMRVGRAIREEAGAPKLEVFPKQAEARDLGNLVKLPGGVHLVSGLRADFVSALPVSVSLETWSTVVARCPELRVFGAGGPARESFPCLAAIQAGIAEGGRNTGLFHLATMLRRGGLVDPYLEDVVRAVAARCDPPYDKESELVGLLESSKQSGPVCGQLPADMHCGDACILERVAGLRTRPGALRHASEGERVVVTLAKRTANIVRFEHEDLVQGTGRLSQERGSGRAK